VDFNSEATCVKQLRINNETFIKSSGYYKYHQVILYTISTSLCLVWISEQTAIISLYSINWLVFITETECVYCAVRFAHNLFMCFVWI
jgi:hypothetical protein